MLLRKIRKLQTGASLNLAKNEAAPIDIRWKQFDISGYKQSPLDIPSNMLDTTAGTGNGKATGGLPSDYNYAQQQLDYYKNKIKTGLTGANAEDYSKTQAKYDSDKVEEWSKALVLLKSMEDNYKTTKTKALKAGDSYAIGNGKALVKNTETGAHEIVDSSDILTERVRDEKGKLKPKYMPTTVAQALDLRFNDPNFSGFVAETGGTLDVILNNAQDTETLGKDMNAMFSRVGSINQETGTYINTATGETTQLEDLLKNLEEAKTVYSKGSTKTNKENLEAAVRVFADNMSPAQKEALQANAIAQFITTYGDREVKTPEDAMDWVNAKVASDIADRAAAFLRVSTASSKKATTGTKSGDSESDAVAKELYMHKIGLARISGTGKKVSIEQTKLKDATDLTDKMNNLTEIDATPVSLRDDFIKAGKGLKPAMANILSQNPLVSKLTEDNLNGNLFLADPNSTPVSSLAGGSGLDRAAVNTTAHGGQPQILRSMPYTVENGQYKIAWEFVDKLQEWGKKYAEIRNAELKSKDVSTLSFAENKEIIRKTIEATKIDPDALGNGVKTGDVMMIPLIVYDTDRGYDDPDLDGYMQSGVTPEEMALIDKAHSGIDFNTNIKRTYGFTVLSDDVDAMVNPDHYGKELALDQKVNIKAIENAARTAQRLYKRGYNMLDVLSSNAFTNPTKPE